MAAREQGWLGRNNHAKQDPVDPTVVVETVTEPSPMVLGYGQKRILEPLDDVTTPMKVFTTI